MEWKRSCPVYPVRDVGSSIDWYRQTFGFEPQVVNPPGDEPPVYAVVSRGAVLIHLLRSDEAPYGLTAPVQAQFWIDDGLEELFERAKATGATVIQGPGDRPWGHRDFMVADPDGNVVWVTTSASQA